LTSSSYLELQAGQLFTQQVYTHQGYSAIRWASKGLSKV
jgi:hypothetical protein